MTTNADGAGNNKNVQSPVQLLSSESQLKLEEKQDAKSPEGVIKEDTNVNAAKVSVNKDAALKNPNKTNETGLERSVQ